MPLFSDYSGYSGTHYSASSPYNSYVPGSSFSASYLGTGSSYSKHSSLGGYSRTPLIPSRWIPPSGRTYSPMLTTISERGNSSPVRITSPRRIPITKSYLPSSYTPRPININTENIDVSRDKYKSKVKTINTSTPLRNESSSPRANRHFMPRIDGKPETGIDSSPGQQRSTIRRGRTVVRLHTIKRKERDSPRKPQDLQNDKVLSAASTGEQTEESGTGWRDRLSEDLQYKDKREKKTLGQKLVEKFKVENKDEEDVDIKINLNNSASSNKLNENTETAQNVPNRSPDRRCSMEMLAEQANLLDSLIRKENLSTTSLDLSKVGVPEASPSEGNQRSSIKSKKRNVSESNLQTTKSDHSLHDKVKYISETKESKSYHKRKSLRKSASGGCISRLDSITEFPKESIQISLPSIDENRFSIKHENVNTKPKLKPKITSTVEVTEPKNVLKFRVEDVSVEEKAREPKKEIYFTAEVEATPIKTVKEPTEKSGKRKAAKKDVIRVKKNNSYDQIDSDEQKDNDSSDNFWDQIGKRETIYLNKRKQIIQDEIDKNRREMFWFPECEESGTNDDETSNFVDNDKVVSSIDDDDNGVKVFIKDDHEKYAGNKSSEISNAELNESNTNEKAEVNDLIISHKDTLDISSNTELQITPSEELENKDIDVKNTEEVITEANKTETEDKENTSCDASNKVKNNYTESENDSKPIDEKETITNKIKKEITHEPSEIKSIKEVDILPSSSLTPKDESPVIKDQITSKIIETSENKKGDNKESSLTYDDNNKITPEPIINKNVNQNNSTKAVEQSNSQTTPTLCEQSNLPEIKIHEQSVERDLKKENIVKTEENQDIPKTNCDDLLNDIGELNKAELQKERTPTSLNKEDNSNLKPAKRPVKEEAALRPLIATPRPLQKKSPQVIRTSSSSESSSDEESSDSEENDDADESDTSEESEFFECETHPDGRTSTGSNDSGFDSSAPTSPAGITFIKKDCDVNCHRKCEKLTANLCGVNQRLLVEALASRTSSKKGGDPAVVVAGGSTASTAQATGSTDVLEQELEASTAYGIFRKTGRFTPPARSIPRFRKYTMEDFNFIKVLGKGSFGKVLLAELRETEYYYAVKCLKKDVVLEDDDVECTLIERKVLALGTNHPYLCHLFATFQTDSHLFFVMEYLNGGDLMFHIQQSGRFPEARARFYAAEVVSGLKFLHKRGIVYRDLKLDNILLDFDGHVRIADFGMCKLQIYLEKTADTFCGTPDYMAPEIIKGLKYNQTVDWWSFGVLLYEMLIGQSPFSGCDEDELFWSICNEMPSYPRFLSTQALTILTRLLDKDARTRLGGTECMHGDIRDEEFFRNIHWDKLERRELDAPFKPRVRHPLDTQYFDRAFTGERPRLTAVEPQVLRSMDQEPFRGFSYTNPNATDR